jgi:hypothetical protein
MAQCLMERRLLDVPFARPFFTQLLRRAKGLDEQARKRREKFRRNSLASDTKRSVPTPQTDKDDEDDGNISDDDEVAEGGESSSIMPWDLLFVHPNMGKTAIAMWDICQRKRAILAEKARQQVAREVQALIESQRDEMVKLQAEREKQQTIEVSRSGDDDPQGMDDSWDEDPTAAATSGARHAAANNNGESKRLGDDSKRERKHSDPEVLTLESSIGGITRTHDDDDDHEEDDQLAPLPSRTRPTTSGGRARTRFTRQEWNRLEELQNHQPKLSEARELEILNSVTLSEDDKGIVTHFIRIALFNLWYVNDNNSIVDNGWMCIGRSWLGFLCSWI